MLGVPTLCLIPELLQAGFAGVVASIWLVEDISTTILMFRFYGLWCSETLTLPEALCRAQQWYRDTTNGEKIAYFKDCMSTQSTNKMVASVAGYIYKFLILSHPKDRDFAHPFIGQPSPTWGYEQLGLRTSQSLKFSNIFGGNFESRSIF